MKKSYFTLKGQRLKFVKVWYKYPKVIAKEKKIIDKLKHKKKNSKLVGTTVYKTLLGGVLVVRRTGVVSTFRTVFSAHIQENAGLLMMLRFK